jgi:hypothetical protein
MSSIKSTISNRTFTSQPMKELEVPDATMPAGFDLEAANARLKERGLPPLSNSAHEAMKARNAVREMSLEEIEKSIADARKAKFTGKEKLGDTARTRIEVLTGLGRLTREVEIDEVRFVLRSLKARELREIFLAVSPFDGTVELSFELRRQTLARSLCRVADTDLDLFLGTTSLEAALNFVEDQDEAILARLYAEYQLLAAEINQKYAIKTPEDAAQLGEDLKK